MRSMQMVEMIGVIQWLRSRSHRAGGCQEANMIDSLPPMSDAPHPPIGADKRSDMATEMCAMYISNETPPSSKTAQHWLRSRQVLARGERQESPPILDLSCALSRIVPLEACVLKPKLSRRVGGSVRFPDHRPALTSSLRGHYAAFRGIYMKT